MQKAAGLRRPSSGSATPCQSTVCLSVRLPNGGVMRVQAPVGQSITAVLVAQGMPLRSMSAADAGHCDRHLVIDNLSSPVGPATPVGLEHDGLEITLDAASVLPQTFWTAG